MPQVDTRSRACLSNTCLYKSTSDWLVSFVTVNILDICVKKTCLATGKGSSGLEEVVQERPVKSLAAHGITGAFVSIYNLEALPADAASALLALLAPLASLSSNEFAEFGCGCDNCRTDILNSLCTPEHHHQHQHQHQQVKESTHQSCTIAIHHIEKAVAHRQPHCLHDIKPAAESESTEGSLRQTGSRVPFWPHMTRECWPSPAFMIFSYNEQY